jgi:hypothetical protein
MATPPPAPAPWRLPAGLGTAFGAAAGVLGTALVRGFEGDPTALLALSLGLLLVALLVAITAVWLTGGVVHIREYRLVQERCSVLEKRLDEVTREAFVAARITGLAVQQRAEGGPP